MISELRAMPASDGMTMLEELVDLFLEGAPARLTQISQSLADPASLAFHAHALKSMSLSLGATRLIKLAQKLEALGHSGAVQGVSDVFEELQTAFADTKAQLLSIRTE
jgi:HPt (histidine-containing phosphotransfer) domain-containing protein